MNFINIIRKRGIAGIYITMLVLAVVFAMGMAISLITHNEQKMYRNEIKSAQAYYTAEAGVEDALYRLKNHMNWSTPYVLPINNDSTTVEISEIIGGVRTITSTGNASDRTRKVQAVNIVSVDEISFYYGAQVGDGGMEMKNGSRVKGNVFSNGSVIGLGVIDDSVVVATNGNRIEDLNIGGDAKTHTCIDCTIGGDLTYVSGGALQNCTASGFVKEQPNEIEPKDLPIPQALIDEWKQEAEAGGVIIGDYSIPGSDTQSLGPVKIEGNLTTNNNSTLIVQGTIWVTGNVLTNNGTIIELDPSFYGANSGIIIVDGKIDIQLNVVLRGTGQPGSYLMLLSTSSSLDPANPAINIDNNAEGAIFYASQGVIYLNNNVSAREITGYKVYLQNNATVEYESGLEDTYFSSGSGGSWEVSSWKEVE